MTAILSRVFNPLQDDKNQADNHDSNAKNEEQRSLVENIISQLIWSPYTAFYTKFTKKKKSKNITAAATCLPDVHEKNKTMCNLSVIFLLLTLTQIFCMDFIDSFLTSLI